MDKIFLHDDVPNFTKERNNMRIKVFILTNNPKVKNIYTESRMMDADYLEVLLEAMNYVHKGHKLITHPLAGSVKPRETKYKSLILTSEAEELDFQSLSLIENAITTTKKFKEYNRNWPDPEKIENDFQEIDKSLLVTGVESLNPSLYELES